MKLISGPRGSGKTTKAIELANEEGAYFVVRSKKRADTVYHSEEYPDLDRFPITYYKLMNHRGGQQVRKVVIDDIDDFVAWVVKEFGVVAGTITEEDDDIVLQGQYTKEESE